MSASEAWQRQKRLAIANFFGTKAVPLTEMPEVEHMKWAVQTHSKAAIMDSFWTLENEWAVHYIQCLQAMPALQLEIMGRDPATLKHVGTVKDPKNLTHWISLAPAVDPCAIQPPPANPTSCIQYPGSQGLCGLNACSFAGDFLSHRPQMTAVQYTTTGRTGGRGWITDPHQHLFRNAQIMLDCQIRQRPGTPMPAPAQKLLAYVRLRIHYVYLQASLKNRLGRPYQAQTACLYLRT